MDIREEGIEVSTGEGNLLITDLQLQNHKRMTAADFLRGHRRKINVGVILE